MYILYTDVNRKGTAVQVQQERYHRVEITLFSAYEKTVLEKNFLQYE